MVEATSDEHPEGDSPGADPAAGAEAHEARALALEREGRLEDAADAFDSALLREPGRRASAEGRARIALELLATDAVDHCRRALRFHQGDPDLQLRMIATAGSQLGTAALPLFEAFVEANPAHAWAVQRLAEMRAEAGDRDGSTAPFEAALAIAPHSKELLLAYAGTLSRARRHAEALAIVDRARTTIGDDRDLTLLEALIAIHAGAGSRADAALASLGGEADAEMARAQRWLQSGRHAEAAGLLERLVNLQPHDLGIWALLGVAWRLTGDARHGWLCEQPGLWRPLALDLPPGELKQIAQALRAFHNARAQPIGQSLRGGTQTAGVLLTRRDPAIGRLRDALADGVRRYLAALPPYDRAHPLLRHRNAALAFGGSWSVRLTGGGFHVPHLHPGGVLSSACYISVPAEATASASQEGWLELGRPPPELGLELAPLAVIRPEPGTLALFPSYLFHGTRPFPAGERLTVAFDVVAA